MSTYLQLCQRLRQEVGASGTGPSAVTNQTGEYKRLVDWVATADEDIQRLHNEWHFMHGSFTVNTVADDGSYTASDCSVTNFREWKKGSFKIYLQSSGVGGETYLRLIDYQTWYEIYNTGNQTSSQPAYFTIAPDRSIKLAPKPNNVYVLSGEYWKSVTTMDENTDTPVYPSEYHMLAVYRAMMSYGRYTGALDVYQDGKNNYRRMLAEMERTQLPEMFLDGPLV